MKLNLDGAVFGEINIIGVGLVLRDVNGDVMLATSKIEFGANTAEAIELLAIFQAFHLYANMGNPKIIG